MTKQNASSSKEELSLVRIRELLDRTTLSTHIIGVIGRGFTNSFYRIHVLVDERWYDFENGVLAAKKGEHPLFTRRANGLPTWDPDRPAVLLARMGTISEGYRGMPGRDGLQAVLQRAHDLLNQSLKGLFRKGDRVRYIRDPAVYESGHLIATHLDEGVVENVDLHPLIAGPTVRWDRTGRVYDLPSDQLERVKRS